MTTRLTSSEVSSTPTARGPTTGRPARSRRARKRYDYPRWEFVNRSDDIIGICTAALDLLCLRWTRPRIDSISVARAPDVRRLDELIGPKASWPDGLTVVADLGKLP